MSLPPAGMRDGMSVSDCGTLRGILVSWSPAAASRSDARRWPKERGGVYRAAMSWGVGDSGELRGCIIKDGRL